MENKKIFELQSKLWRILDEISDCIEEMNFGDAKLKIEVAKDELDAIFEKIIK